MIQVLNDYVCVAKMQHARANNEIVNNLLKHLFEMNENPNENNIYINEIIYFFFPLSSEYILWNKDKYRGYVNNVIH